MARYPGATFRPIPETTTQPAIRATQVILHVSASEARSLFDWWNATGNDLESHFHVARDGYAEQYIDTARSADANYLANRRSDGTGAISVETQGADAGGPWSAAQLDRIVAILRWAHTVHGVPLRLCPGPDEPGIGWHVMWGAPGAWTPAAGKVCPGPARIAQIKNVILPRLLRGTPATTEEDDMADYGPQLDAIKADTARVRALLEQNNVAGRVTATNDRVVQLLGAVTAAGVDSAKRDAAILGVLAALPKPSDVTPEEFAAALAPLLAGHGVDLDAATIAKAVRAELAGALIDGATA